MLGLNPELVDGALYGDLLPHLVAASETDAVYIPSSPWGGRPALPQRPRRGATTLASAHTCVRSRTPVGPRSSSPRNVSPSRMSPRTRRMRPSAPAASAPSTVRGRPAYRATLGRGGISRTFVTITLPSCSTSILCGSAPMTSTATWSSGGATTAEVMAETFRRMAAAIVAVRRGPGAVLADLRPGQDGSARPSRPACSPTTSRGRWPWSPCGRRTIGWPGVSSPTSRTIVLSRWTASVRVALYRDRAAGRGGVDPAELEAHSACEHNVEELLALRRRFVVASVRLPFTGSASSAWRSPAMVRAARCQGSCHFGTQLAALPHRTLRCARADGSCGARRRWGWSACLSSRRFVYGCRIAVPGQSRRTTAARAGLSAVRTSRSLTARRRSRWEISP